jgi:hypothetical protein
VDNERRSSLLSYDAIAIKRVLARQLAEEMKQKKIAIVRSFRFIFANTNKFLLCFDPAFNGFDWNCDQRIFENSFQCNFKGFSAACFEGIE